VRDRGTYLPGRAAAAAAAAAVCHISLTAAAAAAVQYSNQVLPIS